MPRLGDQHDLPFERLRQGFMNQRDGGVVVVRVRGAKVLSFRADNTSDLSDRVRVLGLSLLLSFFYLMVFLFKNFLDGGRLLLIAFFNDFSKNFVLSLHGFKFLLNKK